jgi:hypothetical protein
MAARNKSLAKSNKSGPGGKATKTRNRRIVREMNNMTLQEAKSIARHLGLTLRKVRSGDYRGSEAAYYTDDLEDAVNTAVEMARRRAS